MTHSIVWRDPNGVKLTEFSNFSRLEYIRAENKVGWLKLELDPLQLDPALFRVNMRLEPWRKTHSISPYLDGESVFFLQSWGRAIDSRGVEVVNLMAYDANWFLQMRNIAYYSGSAMAGITAKEIDDAMKDIVRQNLGATATDTDRDLSTWLSVQADLAGAPVTTKEYYRKQVLTTLQALADESYQQGTYLAFDTVYTGPSALEFRTYTGQRGIDHGRDAAQKIIISRESKNLEEPEFIEDHSEEYNYIYAGGKGEAYAKVVKTAYTADAVGLNRREKWVDARNTADGDAIQSEANAALYKYRVQKSLTGRIVDTDGLQYGRDFRFGDILYAEYAGQGYNAHLDAIHITVQGGRENADLRIRGEA